MFPPGRDKPGLFLPPLVAASLLWLLNPLFVAASRHEKEKSLHQTFPCAAQGNFPQELCPGG